MTYTANMGGAHSGAFLGYRIPESHHEFVQSALKDLRRRSGGDGVRLTDSKTWAIHFVDLSDINTVPMKMAMAEFKKILPTLTSTRMRLASIDGIPNGLQPRTVAISLEDDDEMVQAIQGTMMDLFRPFLAQLGTQKFLNGFEVARLKDFSDRARNDLGRALKQVKLGESAPLELDKIELLLPDSNADGPTLRLVETFQLV